MRLPDFPSTLFMDASGIFAAINTRDTNHASAFPFFQLLKETTTRLYLTNYVWSETHALCVSRLGRKVADEFLRWVDETEGVILVHVTQEQHKRALGLIARHRDKRYSVADAVSFVVMEELGISHVFSFDDHFRQYGRFVVLP